MSPARVWMVQCLCPSRHCILATAEVFDSVQAAEAALVPVLRTMIAGALARGMIHAWCALCHSTPDTWTYEVGETPYTTMAEAMPSIRASEAAQRATAAMLRRPHT